MRISAAAISLLILSIAAAPLSAAHHPIVKIKLEGAGLTAPIEITEPGVEYFNVWAGPGVHVNGMEQTEGFIIDWPKGIVEQPPTGHERYLVSFYSGCRAGNWECRTPGASALVYVAVYDYDPVTEQGLVYLPGRDNELFQFNRTMWHGHGFEGNWSRARPEWDSYVAPRIAKAKGLAARR
jgi:hypothetical protein